MIYADLKELVLLYADRADKEVIDRIGVFSTMVESKINRKLRVDDMLASNTVTIDSLIYPSVPRGFLGFRDVEIRDIRGSVRGRTLEYVPPELANKFSEPDGTYYSVDNTGRIVFYPQPAAGTTLYYSYYKTVPPIVSSGINGNWISVKYSDCYIFGILAEISAFVKDIEAFTIWRSRFEEVVSEIQSSSDDTRWSGASMRTFVA